ncbi:MAG: PIN domain-containing protein [Bacteroidetes bacterium]|nr:PIN domain-containing protein [Bacteroidota bacterium]
MEIIVLDTDFCFEYLQKNKNAVDVLDKNPNAIVMLAFTSHSEIIKACENKEHLTLLNARLKKVNLITISIDEEISETAFDLIHKYHLSNAASIPDMLLAATVLKYDCYLATCNKKHFNYIPKLKLLKHNVTPKAGGGFLGFSL